MEYNDIVGRKIGKLEVLKFVRQEWYKKRYNYYYLCRCECGTELEIPRCNLTTEHTRSCGCLKRRSGNKAKSWTGYGDISGRFWTQIKRHAESRELTFNITIEDAWKQFQSQDGKCALTGVPITPSCYKGKYGSKTASLDRIDNTIGYEVDNIQWLHKDVNWMKGKYPLSRFIEVCKLIAAHEG